MYIWCNLLNSASLNPFSRAAKGRHPNYKNFSIWALPELPKPPTPQFGQLYRLFPADKNVYGRKNTDDDNNCCHDIFDQNFGNFDDTDDKKY